MWQLPFDNYEGPLVYLKEGEKIKIDDDELEIRFTPGHSPGHICFYHEAGGFVISGDVLFNGSIGRTDLPGGDFDTLINSIQTQLFTLPDETKVYPGHGPMTTIGFEKMNNPFVRSGVGVRLSLYVEGGSGGGLEKKKSIFWKGRVGF